MAGRGRQQLVASVLQTVNTKKRKSRSTSPTGRTQKIRGVYPDDIELRNLSYWNASNARTYKRSTLLVTITTNKTCLHIASETDIDNFKYDMEQIVRKFLSNPDNWQAKLKTEDYGTITVQFQDPQRNETLRQTIVSCTVDELAWEEGTKYKRLHMHVMVTLKYIIFNGYFHVNREDLFHEIRSQLPHVEWYGRLPYLNLRYIKNAVDSVADYINKLHNQEHFETLAKRTLDRINEYREEAMTN